MSTRKSQVFFSSLKCLVKPHRIRYVPSSQGCCSPFPTTTATRCLLFGPGLFRGGGAELSLLKLEKIEFSFIIQSDPCPNFFDRLFFSQGSKATSVQPEECSAKLAQTLAPIMFHLFFQSTIGHQINPALSCLGIWWYIILFKCILWFYPLRFKC